MGKQTTQAKKSIRSIFLCVHEVFPCIQLACWKFELSNQDLVGGKKLVTWRQVNKSGKALKSGNFSHWKWHKISTKKDLHFQKPYQFAKSEKYEPFCVSKLLFWHHARHGNSLVACRVSPGALSGRIIVLLF